MTPRTICLGLAILFSAGAAQAEEPARSPLVGDRVRVTVPSISERSLIGKLVTQDQMNLVIARDNGSLTTIPVDKVMRLDMSTGKKSKARAGAIIGGLAGVGLFLVAIADYCSDGGCTCSGGCADNYAGGSLVFAAGGAAIGALVGAPIRTERWIQVPARQPTAAGARNLAALGVSVTLRF